MSNIFMKIIAFWRFDVFRSWSSSMWSATELTFGNVETPSYGNFCNQRHYIDRGLCVIELVPINEPYHTVTSVFSLKCFTTHLIFQSQITCCKNSTIGKNSEGGSFESSHQSGVSCIASKLGTSFQVSINWLYPQPNSPTNNSPIYG